MASKQKWAAFLLVATTLAATIPLAEAQEEPTVMCGGLVATIVGTPERDFLEGTSGPDVIAALQGDDVVFGNQGNDVICGGRGDDSLIGGDGFDTIYGAQGNDAISGSWENFRSETAPSSPQDRLEDVRGTRVFGGEGNDRIWGTNRWDRIQGGPGNDVLWGFAGVDRLRGGPGNDIVFGHGGADDLGGGNGADQIFADSVDTNVRAGAGNDACPTITRRSTIWRGCQEVISTSSTSPTLPDVPLPAALSGGIADVWVYGAFQPRATDQLSHVTLETFNAPDWPSFRGNFLWNFLHYEPLTESQAMAVAQSVLVDAGITEQSFIDPSEPYYNAAVRWGRRWLKLNPSIVD